MAKTAEELKEERIARAEQRRADAMKLKIAQAEAGIDTTAATFIGNLGGLYSVNGILSTILGGGQNTNQNNNTSRENSDGPAPPKGVNPWLIGGIAGGAFLFIMLLIFLKNGKSNTAPTGGQ